MQFCSVCNNMYYLRLGGTEQDSQDELVYYCRNCGHEDASLSAQGVCALETHIGGGASQSYEQKISKFTRDDPTLPRTSEIKCPRSDCPSHKSGGTNDVIYLRYDDKQIRYLYICTACEAMWKTSSG